MKEEKYIAPVVYRISKFIEIKGVVILVKVDEMYNIFKSMLVTA